MGTPPQHLHTDALIAHLHNDLARLSSALGEALGIIWHQLQRMEEKLDSLHQAPEDRTAIIARLNADAGAITAAGAKLTALTKILNRTALPPSST